MGRFMKGDVVVLPFPFSDLTSSKKRPAIVVAPLTGDDILVCQVTSKAVSDSYAIPIAHADSLWLVYANRAMLDLIGSSPLIPESCSIALRN